MLPGRPHLAQLRRKRLELITPKVEMPYWGGRESSNTLNWQNQRKDTVLLLSWMLLTGETEGTQIPKGKKHFFFFYHGRCLLARQKKLQAPKGSTRG